MGISDYKVGDRVWHLSMRDTGTVIRVGETVDVQFDRQPSRGRPMIGKYDNNWFKTHEGWLQHTNGVCQEGRNDA